ncbi:MAG: hypothetical protein EPO55_07140 [Reyranella sp.]|uniref:hypothetical protein n=1 Tax=Reyranella sp. TaxID=1929291 RepID=UPI00122A06FB|nr:hypothetical protein [Reyranella sp.]TAJ41018.1 MAG: hypothetical protein EPO55_07140 [Reyranella sp.]
MTRTGPSKPVDKDYGNRRLAIAKAYLKAAQDEATLADATSLGNPIASQIVKAAIAYADAITAMRLGQVNQRDHEGIHKLLRDALGNALPVAQARRLRRIVDSKDTVQYGVRLLRKDEAEQLLSELQEFARWAETELAR